MHVPSPAISSPYAYGHAVYRGHHCCRPSENLVAAAIADTAVFRCLLQVVLYNRGQTPNKQLPCESDAEYAKRVEDVKTIVGDRKDPEVSHKPTKAFTFRHR